MNIFEQIIVLFMSVILLAIAIAELVMTVMIIIAKAMDRAEEEEQRRLEKIWPQYGSPKSIVPSASPSVSPPASLSTRQWRK